jgi:hypothetical protein
MRERKAWSRPSRPKPNKSATRGNKTC